jgi:hypothetical protein
VPPPEVVEAVVIAEGEQGVEEPVAIPHEVEDKEVREHVLSH